MSEPTNENVQNDPKIMCYVCKKMVPKSTMVEIEFSNGKKVWVLEKYIKFTDEA